MVEPNDILLDLIEMEQDPASACEIRLGPYSTWVLVSALQLALSHPEMTDNKVISQHLRTMATRLQGNFRDEAYDLLDTGWDRAQDVPVVPAPTAPVDVPDQAAVPGVRFRVRVLGANIPPDKQDLIVADSQTLHHLAVFSMGGLERWAALLNLPSRDGSKSLVIEYAATFLSQGTDDDEEDE